MIKVEQTRAMPSFLELKHKEPPAGNIKVRCSGMYKGHKLLMETGEGTGLVVVNSLGLAVLEVDLKALKDGEYEVETAESIC